MNGSHGRHLAVMLLAGVGVFAVLLALGVSAGAAVGYAFLLACPLMMVWMMMSMRPRQPGHGHDALREERPTRSERADPSQ